LKQLFDAAKPGWMDFWVTIDGLNISVLRLSGEDFASRSIRDATWLARHPAGGLDPKTGRSV
jgi:hypothetical protein